MAPVRWHWASLQCIPSRQLHSDVDSGDGTIKYILSGDGAGTIFVIDDKTGNIHATKTLDREEQAQYTLTAQAVARDTNKPLEPPSEFIVKVQDINDNPPEFLHGPYYASVPEMSNVGECLSFSISNVWPLTSALLSPSLSLFPCRPRRSVVWFTARWPLKSSDRYAVNIATRLPGDALAWLSLPYAMPRCHARLWVAHSQTPAIHHR